LKTRKNQILKVKSYNWKLYINFSPPPSAHYMSLAIRPVTCPVCYTLICPVQGTLQYAVLLYHLSGSNCPSCRGCVIQDVFFLYYCKKKVSYIPVPSRDVTYQTLPGRG
jgi:hypothetical protein